MSESELLAAVIDLAEMLDVRWQHEFDSRRKRRYRTGSRGCPDLILLSKSGRVLWIELKSERGRLSVEQCEWRDRLKVGGSEWRLWRPVDLDSGEILQTLREL